MRSHRLVLSCITNIKRREPSARPPPPPLSPLPLTPLRAYFVRVRENLHVVLAMSPIGENFRNRTRMYPGLVNCTTIDWFQRWPADALVEVATKFIQDIPVGVRRCAKAT